MPAQFNNKNLITTMLQAEYWIWTGDISPHDIWNITKTEAANNVRLVSKMMRDYSNGLPVFPVIGNHEAHPVNR